MLIFALDFNIFSEGRCCRHLSALHCNSSDSALSQADLSRTTDTSTHMQSMSHLSRCRLSRKLMKLECSAKINIQKIICTKMTCFLRMKILFIRFEVGKFFRNCIFFYSSASVVDPTSCKWVTSAMFSSSVELERRRFLGFMEKSAWRRIRRPRPFSSSSTLNELIAWDQEVIYLFSDAI